MKFPTASTSSRVSLLLFALLVAGCGAGRVSAAEFDRIVQGLELLPGQKVADVGAGDGDWAVQLARYVGAEGHVWATEVDEDEMENIETNALNAFLNNVTAVLGSQSSTGLPDSCCDAILLRMVYHHFVRPEEMRADLYQALKPDGLIAIVDITPQSSWRQLADVPDRGGHGVSPQDVIDEMTSAGFELVSREDNWNGDEDRYCVIFRR